MAQAASHRLRHGHVESLYRRMAAFGDPHRDTRAGVAVTLTAGEIPSAEETYREAAAAGEPEALHELTRDGYVSGGKTPKPRRPIGEAAAAGDQTALNSLAWWLKSRPGREADGPRDISAGERGWRSDGAELAGAVAEQPARAAG